MAKKAAPVKRGRGRPTDYKSSYPNEAYDLCLLGYTLAELGEHFSVNVGTICAWQNKYPKFYEAIKAGGKRADAKVAQALYNRALGYSHKAVKIFNEGGKIIEAEYTEHYPPDFQSLRLWLQNRQPDRWREKPEETKSDRFNELIDVYTAAREDSREADEPVDSADSVNAAQITPSE